MKKKYTQPEFELMKLSFDEMMTDPITPHSVTEYGGSTAGHDGDQDDGDNGW